MGLVAKICELTALSPEAGVWLQNNLEVFHFKKNDTVLKQGKTCNYLYYIKTGMVGSHYLKDETEICNWIAAEDDFATSYYSFISRQPSYEAIECFENCHIQAISYSNLNVFYNLFPESERAGRLILEDYYLRLEERLISIQFRTAKERYDNLMQKRPHIIQRAPLGRIATYLGIKQETLSRIRSGK